MRFTDDPPAAIVRGCELPKEVLLARVQDTLIGRADELASLEQVLEELNRGGSVAIELVGDPGIGKTRLLRELSARAEDRGHLVLAGSASELERALPFSVFVDALDEYVESLDPNLFSTLDDDVQAELAHVLPSLSALAAGRAVALQHERYRSHRAMRALLEHLAKTTPLVLVLDDFHWADSASVELLGALLRRPPAAAVLTVVALRPRQTPERLAAALERADRAAALTRLELGALTLEEARELLGERVDAAGAAVLYRESGGNPFYLEQLARSPERARGVTSAPEISLTGLEVPPAVAASLSEEVALLSGGGRLVLEGAAVAGDPFEPELAAAAAATSEAAAIRAIDELLELDLIRTTEVPRRFRFRHPLVRRAVYEATAGGWRLGAHERCAEALAARGVNAAARAHHVERSARQGDVAAVAVLRDAGEAAARLAPESAAQWFGGALRLLPQTAPAQERVELLLARAGALAAAGHFTDSHEALLEAIAIVPGGVERPLHDSRDGVRGGGALPRPIRGGPRASGRGSSRPSGAGLGRVRRAADRTDAERVLPLEIRGDARLGRARGERGEGTGRCGPAGGGARQVRARGRHDRTAGNSSIPPCRSRSAGRRAVRRRALAPPRRGGVARCG